jgi:hypothetical protein
VSFPKVEEWLNDWGYDENGCIHNYGSWNCAGCGFRGAGLSCYVITGDELPMPEGFPFQQQSCPMCAMRIRLASMEEEVRRVREVDPLTRRAEALARVRGGKP